MHSTTGRGRDSQSLDSDVLANKKSASTRSAISVPQGCGLIRTEFSVGTGLWEVVNALRWRDSGHRNQQTLRALPVDKFLRRFLLHILPQCIFRIMYISDSLSVTAGSAVSVQGV